MSEMQFVKWKEEYGVGVPKLDAQHATILNLLNQLYEILVRKSGFGAINNIMRELGRYTDTHFADEEQLLQEYNYPALEAHKRIHATFAKVTQEYVTEFSLKPADLTHEVFALLKDWWVNHILSMDKKHAPFVQGPRDATNA